MTKLTVRVLEENGVLRSKAESIMAAIREWCGMHNNAPVELVAGSELPPAVEGQDSYWLGSKGQVVRSPSHKQKENRSQHFVPSTRRITVGRLWFSNRYGVEIKENNECSR